jgi:hypothetical protein
MPPFPWRFGHIFISGRTPKIAVVLRGWDGSGGVLQKVCHEHVSSGRQNGGFTKIRVIYPLVTQPPASLTVQAVPNLSAQERQSATRVPDHRRDRYKTRFWPLYAASYNKAKRASQTETGFRMSLTRDDTMKLGFHDLNTYTYERRI